MSYYDDLDKRVEKIISLGVVLDADGTTARVPSERGATLYRVTLGRHLTCTCPHFKSRRALGGRCKHVRAALKACKEGLDVSQEEQARNCPKATRSGHKDQKRNYPRDWAPYKASREASAGLGMKVLHSFLNAHLHYDQPPARRGRPELSPFDALLCVVAMATPAKSGLLSQSTFEELHAAGLLQADAAPRVNTVLLARRRADVGDLMRAVIVAQGRLFRDRVRHAAVDGSDFQAPYSNYNVMITNGKTKRKEPRVAAEVKLHALIDPVTNMVLDAIVTDEANSGEPEQAVEMLNLAEGQFAINWVSADKGYAAGPVFVQIHKMGAAPRIPFKDNSVAQPGSPRWNEARSEYKKAAESQDPKYAAEYHLRSNIEAVFGSLKRIDGRELKSKSFEAQRAEIYAAVINRNTTKMIEEFIVGRLDLPFLPDHVAQSLRDAARRR